MIIRSVDAPVEKIFDMFATPEHLARLTGELGDLYARWEEAERIAQIADRQLTPG